MKRLACSFGILCACAPQTQAPPAQPAPTASAAPTSAPAAAMPASSDMACGDDGQCHNDQICVQSKCEPVSSAMNECGAQRVQFPFNSADMASEQKAGLMRAAHCLMGNRSFKLTIEGNADERGTEEYNLALGEQRARNVAQYLESLGASAAQLKTVSYGKDQPMCTQHDEGCWAQNRRASLKVKSMASD